MQSKMCILGGGEQQLPLVEEAQRRGYKVFLFDKNSECIARSKADVFLDLDIHEDSYGDIFKAVKKIDPNLVTSIASDVAIRTVNKLVEDFNLPGNSYKTAMMTTDKWEMKKKLNEANIPTSKAFLISSLHDLENKDINYPIMVKATDRSGGRGVSLVDSKSSLEMAINNSISNSFNGRVLIEEYFEGKQYSMETLSAENNHSVIAITEEFYTGKPYFVERQHLVPGRIKPSKFKELENLSFEILDAFDIKTGASHIELRINEEGKVSIIEIASRMGGDFRHELIKLSKGISYVGLLIDALENGECEISSEKEAYSLIQWACNKKDVKKLENNAYTYSSKLIRNALQKEYTSSDYVARDGTERSGYVLFSSSNYEKISELII